MPRKKKEILPIHPGRVPTYEKALAKLGLRPESEFSYPRITPSIEELQHILRNLSYNVQKNLNLPGSIFDILEASDHPDARKVLEKYYSVPVTYRSMLNIESYSIAADVPTLRLLEIIVGTIVRMNHSLSEVISHIASPEVVSKTVEMALKDEGSKDREMLHKSTGFIPTPRGGPSVRVNVNQAQNQVASAAASVVAAPRPEDTISRLVDRFNDARPALPAPPPMAAELVDELPEEGKE